MLIFHVSTIDAFVVRLLNVLCQMPYTSWSTGLRWAVATRAVRTGSSRIRCLLSRRCATQRMARRSWCGATVFGCLQCGPQLSVSPSLLCRLLALAARHQPVTADAKQHALTLVKRVAGRLSPTPSLAFAIETTIRQPDRYCTWWTEANGFFTRAATDLSLPAAELSKSAASCIDGTDRRVVGGAHAISSHASATLGVGRINAPRVP